MLEALSERLLTLLGYSMIGISLYQFDLVRSVLAFFHRWICLILHPPLYWFRRFLKWVNWEKVTMFTLAVSLILVTALTMFIPTESSAHTCTGSETDTGIYEGLRVAFSIFEGDSADFRDHLLSSPLAAGESFLAKLLVCLAYGLPIIVPISALSAAITLLWNHLPHHVPIFCRNWYIFSELDANSIRMAKGIHEELKKAWDTGVFIFLRTRRGGQTPEILEDIRELNYFLYPKTEARFLLWPHRRLRRMRFFFLSEQTDENFERMQDLLKAAKARKLFFPIGKAKNDLFQQELYLFSETESAPMLIGHLREILKTSRCFQNTELRLLDRFRATSYDLLRNVPLHAHIQKDHQGDQLHVLVLGFGRIGREFFRASCSLGILHGCTTEFTLCDLDICSKLNGFESQCPELRKSVTIHPRKLDLDTAALENLAKTTDYHYIVVALGDDERNIRVASRLKRFYRLRHWEAAAGRRTADLQPQICVNIEDPIKHAYTEGLWEEQFTGDKALRVFGGLEQVFTPEVLMPRNLWNAARYIHRQLNDLCDDAVPDWSEYERRSSIACALRAAYLDASRPTGASPEALADTEHLRWMAYVRSEGLRYADPALVDAYYGKVKGRHVDILGKLTPCLTEDQVKLEGVWTYLTTGSHAGNYIGKKSFRERDLYLVEHAHEIAERIRP